MVMISGCHGIFGYGRGGWPALALGLGLLSLLAPPAPAQMFSARPPPVPPASVPDVQSGPAMNLAPPSGTGSIPTTPAPLTQPTIVQPSLNAVPPPAAATPSQ